MRDDPGTRRPGPASQLDWLFSDVARPEGVGAGGGARSGGPALR